MPPNQTQEVLQTPAQEPRAGGPASGPAGGADATTQAPAQGQSAEANATAPVTAPAATAPRTGDAGKADTLRSRYAQGVLVSLTIPAAYDSTEEVIKHVDDGHALDGYAYAVNFPRWAAANPAAITAYWTPIKAADPKLATYPADYATAGKQQGKILAAVKAKHYDAIKTTMWGDATWKQKLATTAVINNRFIPDSANSFAKAEGAVAGNTGTLEIGKAMTYTKPDEMGTFVNATSTAVKTLLTANAPAAGAAADQATKDDTASKVRFLSISSHGWPTGMGGHGKAKEATFNAAKVPGIISSMSGSLAPDVNVRLFSCETAHTKDKKHSESEGSLADVFRDALQTEGKTGGGVIGHVESGHTQENSTTRFFSAGTNTGHNDWRASDVFDAEFITAYIEQVGAPATAANKSAIKAEMRRFFSREGWLETTTDLAALKAGCRRRWNEQFPTLESVTPILVNKPPKKKKPAATP